MHPSSLFRMHWFRDTFTAASSEQPLSVLDVGSYNVNGTYRPLFREPNYHYVGADVDAGPNVDLVLRSPYRWDEVATDSFDVVISGQSLEHIEFFWKTLEEMVRVLKPGGLLCLVVPNQCEEHRYPVDCFRFYTDGMVALGRYAQLDVLHAHADCSPLGADDWHDPPVTDAMLVASKPYAGPARLPDFSSYRCIPANPGALRGDLQPCQR